MQIAATPFFWTTAKFAAPGADGELATTTLRVKLVYKAEDEYKSLLKEATEQPAGHGDAWLARVILQGWDGVFDADNKPLAYSEGVRDAAFKAYLPLATSIVRAWVDGQNGVVEGN